MAFTRWTPRQDTTKQEEFLLRRLRRTRKLFSFLRDHRQALFDDAFQAELESMYRDTGAGQEPVPPALLAMIALLQSYLGVSDAEAVELTVVDLRWQMVLDRLGSTKPACAQGTLVDFRERLIRTDMDRRLLERTVEMARQSKIFDWRKLPKSLRVAIDSSPLEGAGRVEDTINLLGHAARKVVQCAADLVGWPVERVAREAGIPVLLQPSVKRGLDTEWSDPDAKACALNTLVQQLDSLNAWLRSKLPEELGKPPLKDHLDALVQIRAQDLEPDPDGGGGGTRIRDGVADERRVSIEDPDMRHGRKSKSKRFNGYKRHIATDLDTNLILACAVTPANRPEEERHRSSRPTSNCSTDGLANCTSTVATSSAQSSARCLTTAVKSSASHGFHATASFSARPTSRSTCATVPLPARQDRSRASTSAQTWNSTRKPADVVDCGPNAPQQVLAAVAQ